MSVAAMTMVVDDQRTMANYDSNTATKGPTITASSPELLQQTQQQQQHNEGQQQQKLAMNIVSSEAVEQRQRLLEEEIENLKHEQLRLTQQCSDAQRREKILMRRLANKEQEFQDYVSQISEYKASQAPTAAALRSALLDPAVNLIFERLKKELKATKAKLEETQNELSAWKFTPDSNTGKRLMAKCRLLYQENEELGKMTSNGRLAKLETELAMQKNFSEEVKKSQSELDDFLQELDEDVEGMQSTILFLQQELKNTRDRIQTLEKENCQLRSGHMPNNENGRSINQFHYQSQQQLEDTTNINNNSNSSSTGETHLLVNGTNNIHSQQNSPQDPHLPKIARSVSQLEPIKEEPCTRLSMYTCGEDTIQNTTEQFNGLESRTVAPYGVAAGDDGSDAIKNRTASGLTARKRPHDGSGELILSEATMMTTAPAQPTLIIQAASPRTLPPKKSKLRVQADSPEFLENGNNLHMNAGLSVIDNNVPVAASGGDLSIKTEQINSTTPIEAENTNSNNSNGNNSNSADPSNNNSNNNNNPPQRIMTRRRSTRNQQNGA